MATPVRFPVTVLGVSTRSDSRSWIFGIFLPEASLSKTFFTKISPEIIQLRAISDCVSAAHRFESTSGHSPHLFHHFLARRLQSSTEGSGAPSSSPSLLPELGIILSPLGPTTNSSNKSAARLISAEFCSQCRASAAILMRTPGVPSNSALCHDDGINGSSSGVIAPSNRASGRLESRSHQSRILEKIFIVLAKKRWCSWNTP